MNHAIINLEDTITLINEGSTLFIAGHDSLLSKLPKGNWIGGTNHYFMSPDGSQFSLKHLYVYKLDEHIEHFRITDYDCIDIHTIGQNSYDSGINFLILPCFTEIHQRFGLESLNFENIFMNPLVGFVSYQVFDNEAEKTIAAKNILELVNDTAGKDVSFVGKVYNGMTGCVHIDKGVALHAHLKDNLVPTCDIVNIFDDKPVDDDEITFLESTYVVTKCLVNGEERNFVDYLMEDQTRLGRPLQTNYSGAIINVSIAQVNIEEKAAVLARPVMKGDQYKFSNFISNYEEVFKSKIPNIAKKAVWACNCISNYLQGNLDGKAIDITAPATYGEIAYTLLNQTMVYLNIESVKD